MTNNIQENNSNRGNRDKSNRDNSWGDNRRGDNRGGDRGWGDNNRYNGRYNSEKEVSKVLSYHYFLFPIIIFYFLSLFLRGQNLFRVKSPISLRPPQGGGGILAPTMVVLKAEADFPYCFI